MLLWLIPTRLCSLIRPLKRGEWIERSLSITENLSISCKEYLPLGSSFSPSHSASASASASAKPKREPLRILALHGWLDNSSSFDIIGPLLSRRRVRDQGGKGNTKSKGEQLLKEEDNQEKKKLEEEEDEDEEEVIVVSADLYGHGRSSHVGGHYQFLDQLEAIHKIMDRLQWPSCVFLAHSFGSNLALIYAAACPERVRALIVSLLLPSFPFFFLLLFLLVLSSRSFPFLFRSYPFSPFLHCPFWCKSTKPEKEGFRLETKHKHWSM